MPAYAGICICQAGDGILRAMRRRNSTADYFELVDRLRSTAGLAIDGYHRQVSETAPFQATYDFCTPSASKIHIFPY